MFLRPVGWWYLGSEYGQQKALMHFILAVYDSNLGQAHALLEAAPFELCRTEIKLELGR